MGYYPLVSVIIATYNAGKYLRRALDSVYSQSYTNVECIVVDGCSKDNTLDIVREYVCKNIVYISEQDLGIYDALNKGVLIAKGEWIYVLGADDELLPDGLRSFFLGENDFEYDIIYGNTIDRYFDGILRYTKSKCCSRVRYEKLLCHQALEKGYGTRTKSIQRLRRLCFRNSVLSLFANFLESRYSIT